MKDDAEIRAQVVTTNAEINDAEWLTFATELADIGRWVYHIETGTCSIDSVLLRLTGLVEPQPMPADLFLARVDPADLPAVEAALAAASEDNAPFHVSFRFHRPDGSTVWLAGKGRYRVQPDGREVIIGVNYEITDLQKAITANHLLAKEMSHRVKNLISLVSGIFRMAQRSAPSVEELGIAFEGRLNALSRLNDLIFQSERRCVAVADLFDGVFGTLRDDGRVTLDVPDFELNGTAAQTLVLAVNELMTNAVKYGALGHETGRLTVSVSVDADEDSFHFRWHEVVPAGVAAPGGNSGFGMNVLTRMTQHTFDGRPEFDWRDDGLTFTCRWSADEMSGEIGTRVNEMRLHEEAIRATEAVQRID